MNSILITGGAGFIGTHTSLVLIEQGFRVILIDSFLIVQKINCKFI